MFFLYRIAPKEKKCKLATKKTHKPEEQVMSEPRHNIVAYLDPEGKITKLKEITKWMRESRINKAITTRKLLLFLPKFPTHFLRTKMPTLFPRNSYEQETVLVL
ncbi:hypothetical protein Hanom_Chr04g00295011 [Helianthus anomalus]